MSTIVCKEKMNTSITETDLHPSCARPWNNLPDNVLKNTLSHAFKLREVIIIPMKEDEREGTVIQVLSDISQFPVIHLCSHNPSNSNPITGGSLYAATFCLTQGEITQHR